MTISIESRGRCACLLWSRIPGVFDFTYTLDGQNDQILKPNGQPAILRLMNVIQNDTDLTSICIQITLICMRTTIDIPEELIEEARRILGFKSKTDTVIVSLQEMIRKKRIEELKSLMGAVELKIDLDQSRRRPDGKRKRRGKS